MTDPIHTLDEEHQLIKRVLTVIEGESERINAGSLPDAELIGLAIDFFAGFADKRHHGKEERLLFPKLAAKKEIIRNGPVKVLTAEHESGRYFVRELREGLTDLAQGDTEAASRLHRALSLYARMLRTHIAKEEDIIFLLSQVLLSEEEMGGLGRDFEASDAALGAESLENFTRIVRKMEGLAASDESG